MDPNVPLGREVDTSQHRCSHSPRDRPQTDCGQPATPPIAWDSEAAAQRARIALSGRSAGGHLASVAALTQNQKRYQPGFEEADTTVTAVASLYGWYGGEYAVGGAASAGAGEGDLAVEGPGGGRDPRARGGGEAEGDDVADGAEAGRLARGEPGRRRGRAEPVSGATVTAKVVSHGRGEKVHIYKMRRRKHYRKSQGHRQNYTEIEIVGITS